MTIIKAAVTRWLTHGKVSQRILDYLQGLLESTTHICQVTNEDDVWGYWSMLMEDCIIFYTCLMVDIHAAMNTLSLAFQKQIAWFI